MSTYYKVKDSIEGSSILCYATKHKVYAKEITKNQHRCQLVKIWKWGLCTITKEAVEWKDKGKKEKKGKQKKRSSRKKRYP